MSFSDKSVITATAFGKVFPVLFLTIFTVSFCRASKAVNPDTLLRKAEQAPKKEKPRMYDRLAKYYYTKEEYLKAYEYFNKALTAAEQVHDSLFMAKSNNNIAVIFDVTGNYDRAAEYYKKALLYFLKLNDTVHMAAVLNNLGIIYEEMGDYNSALTYYRKALGMKKKVNDTLSYAGTLNNIGIIFRNYLKNTDSALYYYSKAKYLYKLKGNSSKEMLCNVNIGTALLDKNETAQALRYFNTALNYFNAKHNDNGRGNALFLTGKVYYLKGEYKKAVHYYDSALVIAKKKKLLKLQKNILKSLTAAEEKLGDTSAAYLHLKQFQKINDELFNRTKAKLLSEHKNSIKIQEQAKEVELLKKEEELNRMKYKKFRFYAWIALIITILTMIIAFLFYKINKQKAEEDLNSLKSQLIRSQLSPHFIFNTLMGIETILMKNKVEVAMDYIVDFARLIRHILENTKETFVSLEDELKAMEQYLKLEEMRFSGLFSYEIVTNLKTPPQEIDVPPMLIQPFLENAIVHAFPTLKGRKGLLKLSVIEKKHQYIIVIEDNGIGREKAAQLRKKHNSMAIELTKNRLNLLKKRKKVNISFQIEDVLDEKGSVAGTRVVFKIQK